MKITPVGVRSELGEGPFWNEDNQQLLYVDMRENLIRSYDPVADTSCSAKIQTDRTPVTLVVRVKGTKSHYVVGLKGGLAVVCWDGRSPGPLIPKYFAEVEDPFGSSRLNDGKADPNHRLWVGTMGAQLTSNPNTFEKDKGSLFRVSQGGKVSKQDEKLQISNGLDWGLKADEMFLIDSLAFKVYKFDYDNLTGSICN